MPSDSSGIAIEVRNLTKTFGDVVALDNLSFAIPVGAIAGFAGPNGSGKSTAMRILATLETQDRGVTKVLDMDVRLQVNRRAVRQALGFMPDYFAFYDDMTTFEFLEFFAAAYQIAPAARHRLVGDILEIVGLTEKKDTLIQGLSRGMQQRLSLGRCLVHDPAVLILDEPAAGLDPRARVELLECLKELKRMGKTILVSSHILSELQALCDLFVLIEKGRLAYCGTLEQASRNADTDSRWVELCFGGDMEQAAQVLRTMTGVSVVRPQATGVLVGFAPTLDSADVVQFCVQNGLRLAEARRVQPSLEQVFLQMTETAAAKPEPQEDARGA